MIMNLSKKLFDKLLRRKYRQEYVAEHVRTGVALQIRTMREQHDLSQTALGQRMGKPQSVVSRLEDPDYGKLTVQSLLDVANAFDVALLVQFVSFPDFIWRTRDVSPKALEVSSFTETSFRAITASPRKAFNLVLNTGPAVDTHSVKIETDGVKAKMTSNAPRREMLVNANA